MKYHSQNPTTAWEEYVTLAIVVAMRTAERLIVYKTGEFSFHVLRVRFFTNPKHDAGSVLIHTNGDTEEFQADGSVLKQSHKPAAWQRPIKETKH